MQGRTRRATAVGAAAFVLAGSAALAAPGTAEATVITGSCGSTITGKPGDAIRVDPSSLLGLPKGTLPALDLGFISLGTKTLSKAIPIVGSVLTKICSVTVTGVNTAASPVESGASAVNQAVTNGAKAFGDAVGGALKPGGSSQKPPANGSPQTPPGNGTNTPGGQVGGPAPGGHLPESTSPVLGGDPASFGILPASFGGGWAGMRDYSGLPYATAGLFAPSPGVRYGGQIPGYAPEFGILGQDGKQSAGNPGIQNAGNAEALPGGAGDGVGFPVLLAVLALSGVSAALVRTWVLRKITG
ncbi:hypothetical protein [Amycolatopsis anabasis]|uniref:hypothetical protein n=1 Tax=Amycolatopsis anabasis TaxID=1840409 RepID=UPI00131DD7B4|nr:hypothetical protein [Amycolatopsis anabasis]